MNQVTRIINAIEQGDKEATERLLPLVYEELRVLAAQKMAQEKPGQTLQATALVHEAYLRLIGSDNPGWDSRGHFFAAAAEAMRRILIENARRKKSEKHGGNLQRVDLSDADSPSEESLDTLLELDEALTRLSEIDPAVSDLVKLRYFAGLSIEHAAKAQGIARRTAVDHWAFARAWLRRELAKSNEPSSD
jgi:RNA polymerase sigma factor (TIGR02999 family)